MTLQRGLPGPQLGNRELLASAPGASWPPATTLTSGGLPIGFVMLTLDSPDFMCVIMKPCNTQPYMVGSNSLGSSLNWLITHKKDSEPCYLTGTQIKVQPFGSRDFVRQPPSLLSSLKALGVACPLTYALALRQNWTLSPGQHSCDEFTVTPTSSPRCIWD